MEFMRKAFLEFLGEEDGLFVGAPGLGFGYYFLESLVSVHNEHASVIASRAASSSSVSSSSSYSLSLDSGGESSALSPTTVLVINVPKEEQDYLMEQTPLGYSSGSSSSNLYLTRLTSAVPQDERARLYKAGGVFLVSSRIAIVDLLSSRCPPHIVTGVVVMYPEHLTEDSVEAFILRVYREGNKTGFIKAICCDPTYLVRDCGNVEHLMRVLHVRHLSLWPRVRADVKAALDPCPPDVIELEVPMTPRMLAIHAALLELIRGCVKEVAAAHSLVEIEELIGDADALLTRHISKRLRAALEPVWRTVSPKSRQLVADISSFQRLLDVLISCDCVTFLRTLETFDETMFRPNGSNATHSDWLISKAADTLFQVARERVYITKKAKRTGARRLSAAPSRSSSGEGSGSSSHPPPPPPPPPPPACIVATLKAASDGNGTTKGSSDSSGSANGDDDEDEIDIETYSQSNGWTPVLEENPKWELLYQVLLEIEKEHSPGRILVVTKDERTCTQLQNFLTLGSKSSLRTLFLRYITNKAEKAESDLRQRQAAFCSKSTNRNTSFSGSFSGAASFAFPGTPNKAVGPTGTAGGNTRKRFSRRSKKQTTLVPIKNVPPAYTGFASYVNTANTASAALSGFDDGDFTKDVDDEGNGGDEYGDVAQAPPPSKAPKTWIPFEASLTEKELSEEFGLLPAPQVVIRALKYRVEYDGEHLLETVRPSFVVIYDPNTRFTRQVEMYKARHPELALRVYFLLYEDSVERRKFYCAVRHEAEAFETLIQKKASMPALGTAVPLSVSAAASTEDEGMPPAKASNKLVLVDLREFRSSLPSMLHRKGLIVRPTHLEIGDYILSPDIAIERKSLQDLFQSFASGRLFTQAEGMSKKFARPMLLIEWYQSQQFYLPTEGVAGSQQMQQQQQQHAPKYTPVASERDIHSKLVLLVSHFPRLSIIWSRSPAHTAEIFDTLKAGRPDPSPEYIAADTAIDHNPFADTSGKFALSSAMDFLLRVPGFSEKNVLKIMEKIAGDASSSSSSSSSASSKGEDGSSSISRLSRATSEELTKAFGDEQVAAKVAQFFAFSPYYK